MNKISHVLDHSDAFKNQKLKRRSVEWSSLLEETTSNNLTFNSSRLNMSSYGKMNIPGKHWMDREDEKEMNIYANVDPINSFDVRIETENTKRHQTPQHTEMASVRIKSSRSALVCLVLLCVLLLTAVIVLGIHIHTKSTNYIEERDQLLNKITNLTEERDGLIMKNKNLNETDQLRNELQIYAGWARYQSSLYYISNEMKSWTESRRYCTERGADLIIINNREEQDFVKNISGAAVVYIGLTDSDVENTWKWVDGSNMTSGFWAPREPNGDTRENCVVTVAVPKLPEWPGLVGWIDVACNIAYQWICEKNISHLIILYYISNKTKSWAESRRYCTERGADLIIINNKEEQSSAQDLVKNMSVAAVVWIGLTDSDVENTWKWVDGSTLTSG
ncbi:killer cell lectin-like receptor subfamily F member 1 [Megalobrama amblycephala]|uniref:killer cell lectin-like receptor subfamily F member 1 n=1 Tax=Megalobrama amblycephala TaxID=75352 RepID=UPI002013F8E5|nr:killer cell lectin-like receptor subfamily F member 1 [Megalobrama amblycephala]